MLVVDDCPEEAKTVIRAIYVQSRHDEISPRDAAELLERSRLRTRDGSAAGRPGAASSASAAAGGSLVRSASGSIGSSGSGLGGQASAGALLGGLQADGAALASNNGSNGTASGGLSKEELAQANANAENIRQILIYPQGKGGISINTEDYMCLAVDQYLNDVIIDFYLKYLLIERLSEEQRQRTHVFSTFFYKRLTTMTTAKRGGEQAKMTASQKRHFRVKNWTKSVNLFEKDFIIIPINEQSHWFLAIVCFPSLKGPVTMDGGQPVVPSKRPAKRKERKRVALQIGNTTITPVSKRDLLDTVFLEEDDERDEAEGDDSDLASDDSDPDVPSSSTGAAGVAAAAGASANAAAPTAAAATSTASISTAADASKPVAVKQ